MEKYKKSKYFYLSIILIVAILVRVYGIEQKYPGVDELRTLQYKYIVTDMLTNSVQNSSEGFILDLYKQGLNLDFYGPLTYLVYGLIGTISNSLLALRIATLVLSIILLILLFVITERIFNTQQALIVTLLMTFNPMSVIYSQHTRPYMLLMILFLISTWFCINIITRERTSDYWILCSIYLISLYTHYHSAFFIIGQVSMLLFLHFKTKRINLKLLFLCLLIISALFAPWLPTAFDQYNHNISNSDKKPRINIQQPIEILYPFYKMGIMADLSSPFVQKNSVIVVIITVLITGLVLIGMFRFSQKEKLKGTFCVANVIIPTIVLALLGFFTPLYSFIFTPLYSFRYLSFILPLYLMFLGVAVNDLNKKWKIIISIIILVFWITVIINYFSIMGTSAWRDDFAV